MSSGPRRLGTVLAALAAAALAVAGGDATAVAAPADTTPVVAPPSASTNAAPADTTAAADRKIPGAVSAQYRTAQPVSPTLAAFMTPVWPGWGQLYSDNGWRGALAFGAEMFYWSRLVMYDRKAERLRVWQDATTTAAAHDYYGLQIVEYRELLRDNAWWSAGALLIATLDAYVGAHLHRFDSDSLPVPEDWDPGDLPQRIELPPPGPTDGAVVLGWATKF